LNGFDFENLNPGFTIGNVILTTNIVGLDASRVAFTGSSVKVDMEGLFLTTTGESPDFFNLALTTRRSRALHLGDDDPRLHGRWLHGLSPQGQVHVSPRLIGGEELKRTAAFRGGFWLTEDGGDFAFHDEGRRYPSRSVSHLNFASHPVHGSDFSSRPPASIGKLS